MSGWLNIQLIIRFLIIVFRMLNWMSNWLNIQLYILILNVFSLSERRGECKASWTFSSTSFYKVFPFSECRAECWVGSTLVINDNFVSKCRHSIYMPFSIPNVELNVELAEHSDRHLFDIAYSFSKCRAEYRADKTLSTTFILYVRFSNVEHNTRLFSAFSSIFGKQNMLQHDN